MKITVLIVTYGNRAEILNSCLNSIACTSSLSLISEIVIVDNASSWLDISNKNVLFEKILVLKNLSNLGSAGGVNTGLSYINENYNDRFVLVLDDDNLISTDFVELTINQLQKALSEFDAEKGEVWKICVRANRVTRGDLNLQKTRKSEIDSFCDFRLFSRKIKKESAIHSFGLEVVNSAPWGGLFFHQDVVKKIGLPLHEYFVYGDDYEYTMRMSKNGIKIINNNGGIVRDACISSERSGAVHRYFQCNFSSTLLFFQVRNHAHASKLYFKNPIRFYLNILGFVFLNICRWARSPMRNFHKLVVILKAANAGLRFSPANNSNGIYNSRIT